MKKFISIVVPVYNEEENLAHFTAAICETMETLPYDWEILLSEVFFLRATTRLNP